MCIKKIKIIFLIPLLFNISFANVYSDGLFKAFYEKEYKSYMNKINNFKLNVNKKEIENKLKGNLFDTDKLLNTNSSSLNYSFKGIDSLNNLYSLIVQLYNQQNLYNYLLEKYPIILKVSSYYLKNIAFIQNNLKNIFYLELISILKSSKNISISNKELILLYNFSKNLK